ncbi:hypothetical protein Trydic_g18052 [Trypoxylus dichotomus]
MEAKQKSWIKFGLKLERDSNGNKKLFFKVLKNMRNDRKEDSVALKDKEGQILRDGEMIITRWKKYFQDLLNSLSEITTQEIHNPSDSRDNASRVYEEEKIGEEQMEEVIKRLKNGKAPEDDKLANEMFKNMGYHARQLLLNISNNVWRKGESQKIGV